MEAPKQETKNSEQDDDDDHDDYETKNPDVLRGGLLPKTVMSIANRFVEVAPRLFLASADMAGDAPTIAFEKITHVLHVGVRLIEYQHVVRMPDEDVDVTKELYDCHAFIKAALLSEARVLVHCFAGSSRSPTVLAAHLVLSGTFSSGDEAFKHIMFKAPWIIPSGWFQRMVRQLEQRDKK